jgi:methylmalonyl-CoA/ethylmalonyl-CoA epimerase
MLIRTVALSLLAASVLPAQQPTPIDPGLSTLVQVAIVTRDIEASAKRWAAVLGKEVPKISTTRPGAEVQVMFKGKPSGGQAKLAFFNLGQVSLELIEPVGKDTSWKLFLDERGEGVQHIGFQVQNLPQAIANGEKEGMKVLHRGRYDKDNGDYVYLDSQKALGVVIELLHSDPPKK